MRSCALYLCLPIMLGLAAEDATASDPAKVVGPNACAECHKQEAEAWQGTRHFKTFREMPRRKEASEIAARMDVQRIRSEGLCMTCHFTVQQKENSKQPIAGVSCESCHSSGDDWVKVHSQFSGKTEKTESKAEAEARWKLADSKGMIRPSALYRLAKNCYGCHVVPQEDLVNRGGHPAGSAFELVSWSQGEVRHNTWHSKGKENVLASAAHKRMLYIVGLGVEKSDAQAYRWYYSAVSRPQGWASLLAVGQKECREKLKAAARLLHPAERASVDRDALELTRRLPRPGPLLVVH